MIDIPPRSELRRRLPRLLPGLVACGVGLALMVLADLGLGPWIVLDQGLSERTGIPVGATGILVGLVVLLTWVPLRQRLGVGTVCNVAVIGMVLDAVVAVVPAPQGLWPRSAFVVAGVALVGLGSGLYIGAGLGPGPRDGVMTGLAARGYSLRLVRTGLEVAALLTGWLLGGSVGVGTVLFAFAIGPLVQAFLDPLRVAGLTGAD